MKFSPLFSSHAVLQREKALFFRGKCRPFQIVKVTFADVSHFCTSDGDGYFTVSFAAMPAGGPYNLIGETLDGEERAESNDIMVGEVWIAGGQSNMEFCFGVSSNMNEKFLLDEDPDFKTKEYTQFLQENTNPEMIRFIKIERNPTCRWEKDVKGEWQQSKEPYSDKMSCVAAWFALTLAKRFKNIAIGFIDNSWGGTTAEAWTSEPTLRRNPDIAKCFEKADDAKGKQNLWGKIYAETPSLPLCNSDTGKGAVVDKGISDEAKAWANPDYDDSDWQEFIVPGSWIARGISGNGAVWIRQEITLPDNIDDDGWTLHLGSIDKMDIAFINGVEVGRTGKDLDIAYWAVPRHYPLPKGVLRPGKNTIAVRAYSHSQDGSIMGPRSSFRLESPKHEKFFLDSYWKIKVESDYGRIDFNDTQIPGPGFQNTPSILFDTMLRPIAPFALRGVIWYQGENNAVSYEMSTQYKRCMIDLIHDWRALLENGEIPFLQTMLPIYTEKITYDERSPWAILRECQQKVSEELQDVAAVPIMELGEANDIHPARKRVVGERLAAWAFNHVYGYKDELCEGPLCTNVKYDGNEILLTFDSDLVVGEEGLCGFCAGASMRDMKETTASLLDSRTVKLTNIPQDASMVCYAWSDNPYIALFNKQGWPAKPFRKSIV